MAGPDTAVQTFVDEMREHLDTMEAGLLAIEQGEELLPDLIHRTFRAAHSIKGGASFFQLTRLRDLAHAAEDLLALLRDGRLSPNPEVVTALLLAFDFLRTMAEDVGASESVPIHEVLEALHKIRDGAHVPATPMDHDAPRVHIVDKDGALIVSLGADPIEDAHDFGRHIWFVGVTEQVAGAAALESLIAVGSVVASPTTLQPGASLGPAGRAEHVSWCLLDTEKGGEELHTLLARDPDSPEVALFEIGEPFCFLETDKFQVPWSGVPVRGSVPTGPSEKPDPGPTTAAPTAKAKREPGTPKDTSLRVSAALLERLMNLAGELVLGRNELAEAIRQRDTSAVSHAAGRVGTVTSELQEAIMLARMQPLETLFSRFTRLVRDVSKTLGKSASLKVEGGEVELDRAILERLSDPLTHLVRNSLDHGIEAPDEREAAGKPRGATITLRAYHEAGQVHVVVEDDGRGIDPQKIVRAAVAKGLIEEARADTLSPEEKTALIFLPGFSTAKEVTDLSGRGVGMDVVRMNLAEMGGTSEIDSEVGRGTRFTIRLPLTLAIVPALVVDVGGRYFAIGQASVEQLLLVRASEVATRIVEAGGAEVLRVRDELVPIIELSRVLGIPRTYRDPESGELGPDRRSRLRDRRAPRTDDAAVASRGQVDGAIRRSGIDRRYHHGSDLTVVLVMVGSFRFAMVVDGLHDTVEIVVKPLGAHLRDIGHYSGATVLGNGQVALILEPLSLARSIGIGRQQSHREAPLDEPCRGDELADAYVLFRNGPSEPCALPMGTVERVLSCTWDEIQPVLGRDMLVRAGRALPVFALSQVPPFAALARDIQPVCAVARVDGREVGLLVQGPIEAVRTEAKVDARTLSGPGIGGLLVLEAGTAVVVDLPGFVRAVCPDWTAAS